MSRKRNLAAARACSRRYYLAHRGAELARAGKSLTFLGKRVYLTKNPRAGVCTACGKIRQPGERQFEMHHDEYVEGAPLERTRELCTACHNLEHSKSKQPRPGRRPRREG